MNREELLDYMESRDIEPDNLNVIQFAAAYELIMKNGTVGNALERCVQYERDIEEGRLVYK